ncbi:MAG: hypothetical protein OEZ34_09435 [Spirochaetia bacterium]|nr:hypothetical protein [Spirochaetia bacterium]
MIFAAMFYTFCTKNIAIRESERISHAPTWFGAGWSCAPDKKILYSKKNKDLCKRSLKTLFKKDSYFNRDYHYLDARFPLPSHLSYMPLANTVQICRENAAQKLERDGFLEFFEYYLDHDYAIVLKRKETEVLIEKMQSRMGPHSLLNCTLFSSRHDEFITEFIWDSYKNSFKEYKLNARLECRCTLYYKFEGGKEESDKIIDFYVFGD